MGKKQESCELGNFLGDILLERPKRVKPSKTVFRA